MSIILLILLGIDAIFFFTSLFNCAVWLNVSKIREYLRNAIIGDVD